MSPRLFLLSPQRRLGSTIAVEAIPSEWEEYGAP